MKKRKGNAGLQETVSQLERLAAASQLAAYLVEAGFIRDAVIIPPAYLTKSELDRWPPITTAQ